MQITSFFLPPPPCPRRCTFSELENRCLLSKFFIREKSCMGRDQGDGLLLELLEYDVLTGRLIPGGTCEPITVRDHPRLGIPKMSSVSPNNADV
ncbi:hypothetical protein AVEN_72737-1 [Araneus ventricosus]|uniref:Uncharacterized protein n=1 Tax=Araneus ventricosus TaxID=182803 RepID=A0A4Y2DRK5_ARAVE|nr:hypothetical protein AVEN_72737-1 [Araneus ventricosus]